MIKTLFIFWYDKNLMDSHYSTINVPFLIILDNYAKSEAEFALKEDIYLWDRCRDTMGQMASLKKIRRISIVTQSTIQIVRLIALSTPVLTSFHKLSSIFSHLNPKIKPHSIRRYSKNICNWPPKEEISSTLMLSFSSYSLKNKLPRCCHVALNF